VEPIIGIAIPINIMGTMDNQSQQILTLLDITSSNSGFNVFCSISQYVNFTNLQFTLQSIIPTPLTTMSIAFSVPQNTACLLNLTNIALVPQPNYIGYISLFVISDDSCLIRNSIWQLNCYRQDVMQNIFIANITQPTYGQVNNQLYCSYYSGQNDACLFKTQRYIAMSHVVIQQTNALSIYLPRFAINQLYLQNNTKMNFMSSQDQLYFYNVLNNTVMTNNNQLKFTFTYTVITTLFAQNNRDLTMSFDYVSLTNGYFLQNTNELTNSNEQQCVIYVNAYDPTANVYTNLTVLRNNFNCFISDNGYSITNSVFIENKSRYGLLYKVGDISGVPPLPIQLSRLSFVQNTNIGTLGVDNQALGSCLSIMGDCNCNGVPMVSIIQSHFTENTAEYGGAIYTKSMYMDSCVLNRNVAQMDGGAIFITGVTSITPPTITNSKFSCDRNQGGTVTNFISGPYLGSNNDFVDSCGAQIQTVTPNHGPTEGGTIVVVTATDIPDDVFVTIGNTNALNMTRLDNTTLSFVAPSGLGQQMNLILNSFRSLPSPPNVLWSYDAPILTFLSPQNGPTEGNSVITVFGNNFYTGQTTVFFNNQKLTPLTCNFHTLAFLLPAGTGASLLINVQVGTLITPLPVLFSYDAPQLSFIAPLVMDPTQSSYLLTLTGQNFGSNPSDILVQLIANNATWVASEISSLNSLVLRGEIYDSQFLNRNQLVVSVQQNTHGYGPFIQLTVSVKEQESNQLSFSFYPAVLTSISTDSSTSAGGTIVTVQGEFFIDNLHVMKCVFDNVTMTPLYLLTSTSGYCYTPAHLVGQGIISITNDNGQRLSNHFMFTYYMGCQAGSVGDLTGKNCTFCDVGTYQPNFGKSSCLNCDSGTYQDQVGATSCSLCPSHSISFSGSTNRTDCMCLPGYYFTTTTTTTTTECTLCPSGALCQGEFALPIGLENYYQSPFSDIVFYQCLRPGVCLGNNTCDVGHYGFLCDQCESGYWKLDHQCLSCSPHKTTGFIFLCLFVVVVVLFIITYIEKNLFVKQEPSTPKIFNLLIGSITFLQLVYLFTHTSLGFSQSLQDPVAYMSIFNIDFGISGSECYLHTNMDYYHSLIKSFVTPFLLLGLILFLYLFLKIYNVVVKTNKNTKHYWLATSQLLVMLMTTMFIDNARVWLGFFDCIDIENDGYTWINSYRSIQCDTDEYEYYKPFAVVGLLFYVCFPVCFLFYSIYTQKSSVDMLVAGLSNYSLLSKYKPLLDLLFKLVIVFIFMLHINIGVQALFILALLGAYIYYILHYQPYERVLYNVLEKWFYALLVCFIFSGCILYMNNVADFSFAISVIIYVFVSMIFFVAFGLFIYGLWVDRIIFISFYETVRDKVKQKCCCRCCTCFECCLRSQLSLQKKEHFQLLDKSIGVV
jgi:hypothetical protein